MTSRLRPGARRGAGGAPAVPTPLPRPFNPSVRDRPTPQGAPSGSIPHLPPTPRRGIPSPAPSGVPAPAPRSEVFPGHPPLTAPFRAPGARPAFKWAAAPPRAPKAGRGPESQVPTHLLLGHRPRLTKTRESRLWGGGLQCAPLNRVAKCFLFPWGRGFPGTRTTLGTAWLFPNAGSAEWQVRKQQAITGICGVGSLLQQEDPHDSRGRHYNPGRPTPELAFCRQVPAGSPLTTWTWGGGGELLLRTFLQTPGSSSGARPFEGSGSAVPQLCTHAPAGGGAARPPGGEPGWFNFLCFPRTHALSWRPRITSRCRRGRCSRPQFAAAAAVWRRR